MAQDTPLRIVIVDDQPLIRSGLSSFLMIFDGMLLVGEAHNGIEALELCELVEPDVILMDTEMPEMDGFTATRTITECCPQIRVILLGDSNNESTVQRALDAGACSYLSKNIDAEELAGTIQKLYQSGSKQRRPFPRKTTAPLPPLEPAPARDAQNPRLAQELEAAGKIQADLLPAAPPNIRGWDLAAHLSPARETSGDFFDFIPLANNNWGIVIADVTDKGMGAALFMALCSTLIRTYATQYTSLPALAISTVNDRILSDSRGDMFVTAFFGVLEPDTGRLRYVNAGHNPPMMFSYKKSKPVESLEPTGMALGVMDNMRWEQKIVKFAPGDMLLLYTDGITEAQDQQGRFFGSSRLLQMARALHGRSAKAILDSLMTEIQRFVGDSPPQDDIAIMVVVKK